MTTIEIEFPHVLAHGIPPDTASHPIADVVVYFAVVNKCSVPPVKVTTVLVYPGGVFDRILLTDKMVNRYFSQNLGTVINNLVLSWI